MSYILDALRKSQQARQPGTVLRSGPVHNISPALPVSGWWLALGIVLLFGVLLAVYLFWRNTAGTLPSLPPEPMANVPIAAAPTSVVPAPTKPVAVEKPVPPPEAPPIKTIPVADLAEQAKVPVPLPPPPKKAVSPRTKKKSVAARGAEAGKADAAPDLPLATDNTPLLQQMPEDFQRSLPSLAVTIHVYSHDESQRILFINNQEYRKGSQIEGGIRVEDIVSDGVVLSSRGERFKLSRPR